MELEKIYQAIITGRAMLITGSGAHMTALGMNGEKFPSGVALAERLYKSAGIVNPENPYDLQDAADSYLETKSSDELIAELKKVLYVSKVQKEHEILYGQDWQRVYTTNYDEVPILASKDMEEPLYAVTLSDDVKLEKSKKKQCVYINGYIGNLSERTLQSEFRLSGRSYASESLNQNAWGAIFSDDLTTVECVVIVGLSLDYDLDLKRLIYAQNVHEKIVFIEDSKISEDKKRKLKRYGTVYAITMEEFTKGLDKYKSDHPMPVKMTDFHIYQCFEVAREKNTIEKATSLEVHNFFMTGQSVDSLWHTDRGIYDNLIFRKQLKEVKEDLKNNCRVIYVHANLGNGKTIFAECLKHLFEDEGYQIFCIKTQ